MKINNQDHKDWNWKKKKNKHVLSLEKRKKKKRNDHQQQIVYHSLPRNTPAERGHNDNFKNIVKWQV